jgi:hypothetical protein
MAGLISLANLNLTTRHRDLNSQTVILNSINFNASYHVYLSSNVGQTKGAGLLEVFSTTAVF